MIVIVYDDRHLVRLLELVGVVSLAFVMCPSYIGCKADP